MKKETTLLAIASVDPQFILNHESLFPGAIVHNARGVVQSIDDTFQNIGRLETEGVDFGVTYTTKEFVWGKVDFEFNANYIQRYVIQNLLDQPFIVKAGTYTLSVYEHSAQVFYLKTLFGMDTLSTGIIYMELCRFRAGAAAQAEWEGSYDRKLEHV